MFFPRKRYFKHMVNQHRQNFQFFLKNFIDSILIKGGDS
jgi:hypothetical protein